MVLYRSAAAFLLAGKIAPASASSRLFDGDEGNPIYPNSTLFMMEQVNLPDSELLKSRNVASGWVKKDQELYKTEFHTLIRSGDEVGDAVFGRNVDQDMNTIYGYPMDDEGSELAFNEPTDVFAISNNPDYISMLKNDAPDRISDYVMFTHFENPRPGVVYRIDVDLNDDCTLEVKGTEPVGKYLPCLVCCACMLQP
jgi:hypothetical protein